MWEAANPDKSLPTENWSPTKLQADSGWAAFSVVRYRIVCCRTWCTKNLQEVSIIKKPIAKIFCCHSTWKAFPKQELEQNEFFYKLNQSQKQLDVSSDEGITTEHFHKLQKVSAKILFSVKVLALRKILGLCAAHW